MDELVVKTFVCGELSTNAYLIYFANKKNAFIVDFPAFPEQLLTCISHEKINVSFILLTHGHYDHIGGLNDVDYPFSIHEQDKNFLTQPELNFSQFITGENFKVKRKGNIIYQDTQLQFGDYPVQILHTPGHTPGSISIKIGKFLFSGDTLFNNSVGRTDIPYASHQVLIKSIKEKQLVFADDTIIYPGHGLLTTIGEEKQNNPYLI